jgi:hypothetical protein
MAGLSIFEIGSIIGAALIFWGIPGLYILYKQVQRRGTDQYIEKVFEIGAPILSFLLGALIIYTIAVPNPIEELVLQFAAGIVLSMGLATWTWINRQT